MAATLHTEPPAKAYHRDDTFVAVETDQITLAPATVDIDFTSTGPTVGQTLELEWLNTVLEFTVASTTSDDALSIPTKSGLESLAEYAERVAEALRENDILTTDWEVLYLGLVSGAQRVRLQYRTAVALDVTATEGLDNVAVTVTDGDDPAPVDNLTAAVQVYTADDDPNNDTRVVTLHAPYELDTSRAWFNLKDLVPVAPALPTASTIGQPIATEWPHGLATAAFQRYFLRYGEKSGVPAVASAMRRSAAYYMLHGSRRGNFKTVGGFSFANLQHSYRDEPGTAWAKPVADDQPDWIYLWMTTAATDCRVEYLVQWDNGDTTTETFDVLDTFDLDQYRLYWFVSGPAQAPLDNFDPPTGATEPVGYYWRLLGDVGLGGETLLTQVQYLLACPCHPWRMYLLLDNGLGGCESVFVRGRVKTKYTGQRDTARRTRWVNHSQADGDLFTYNAEGQHIWELSTGWHPRYYIEHLRQAMLGQLWLIDTLNKRFLRVVLDTSDVEVYEDDNNLHSLNLTIRAGWLDANYHLNDRL
mgnify:CR=1 FL=1